ncbi:hypothetical protein [Paenarthrobacter sp. NCHU4564]|uniref:hypothetical protein n=1 Tax=Paenarthrobacter sp. NCHU4564 TaxID=3451353 RepID=UPI003F96A8F5
MVVDGVYTPPPDEYVRPTGRYWLNVTGLERFDNHFVRGASYHQDVLGRFVDGQELEVELVPEPGNPHDPWAVAFHVKRRRIGYMASDHADGMHEYIAGHNRHGRGVYAAGKVRVRPEDGARLVTVFLPWWPERDEFEEDSGVPAECDLLLNALSQDERERIMQKSQDLSKADARLIRTKRHLAPHLVWKKSRSARIPNALRFRLIELDRERRRREQELLQAAREEAREAKRQEKAAKAEAIIRAREILEASICHLARQGVGTAAIAREVNCSDSKVRSTLQRAGLAANNANDVARNERLQRGQRALILQKGGHTRNQIAQILGCGFDTVKDMLKDAKFFSEPASDTERLDRALAVREAGNYVKLADAAEHLGWPIKLVKAARSDMEVLDQLYPDLMVRNVPQGT